MHAGGMHVFALIAHLYLSNFQVKSISEAIRGGLYITAPDTHYDILNPALALWRSSDSSIYCTKFWLRDLRLWL